MNLIFYGRLFITAGVWKAVREHRARNAFHVHLCWQCGATWRHDGTRPDDVEVHTCPRCGVQQWIGTPDPEPSKMPPNPGGAAQGAAVSRVADGTASPATAVGLRPERPAPSPKDRDTADHGAGPVLPQVGLPAEKKLK